LVQIFLGRSKIESIRVDRGIDPLLFLRTEHAFCEYFALVGKDLGDVDRLGFE